MGVVALAEPQRVKISSKRQVTIPARWYREMGFDEYALATWTEDGLLLQPISVDDEDVTVDILRQLIAGVTRAMSSLTSTARSRARSSRSSLSSPKRKKMWRRDMLALLPK